MVFEYFYDIYVFEVKHVCKLNWPKRPSEVLSFSVRRLLSITFHINIFFFLETAKPNALTILRYQVLGLFCSACIYSTYA